MAATAQELRQAVTSRVILDRETGFMTGFRFVSYLTIGVDTQPRPVEVVRNAFAPVAKPHVSPPSADAEASPA